jgi:Anti-sigma-K factor rskA
VRTPDFDDIVGTEGSPEELAELRQVHNLLLSAEPPPTLPERLRKSPRRRPAFARTWAAAAFGFAAVLASLTAGLAIGRMSGHDSDAQQAFSRSMHGIGTAAAASAVIKVGGEDASGNRTLRMAVHSLPSLPRGYYTLDLTEKGEPLVACGVFRTGPTGSADVSMNAPADLAEYDGWIVSAVVPGQPTRVLLTT